MRILVYGAGVLGSLYAARLQQSGQDVTVLARGQRLADIRQFGVVLCDETTGQETTTPVTAVDRLEPDAAFDWILVIVRKNQLPDVLPPLGANHAAPNVLFMVNNAAGPDAMIQALGRERVTLGFAGAGGAREGHVVRYSLTASQKTTIGELDGQHTPRIGQLADALRQAGFTVAVSPNMDAWLKTHVALVSPIANAIYASGGSARRMAHTPDALLLTVRAMREGLRALQTLDIPVTPPLFSLLASLPEPLLVPALARAWDTDRAELVLARHANAARDEMTVLADELLALTRRANTPAPALEKLYAYLDPARPPMAEGSRTLPPDWLELARFAAPALALLAAGLLLRKRR